MLINKEFKLTHQADSQYLAAEAYDIIRTIRDPEFPYSLEQLSVVDEDLVLVVVDPLNRSVNVEVTWVPTSPTCGFALNIALCIRAKLEKEFSQKHWMKVDIFVQEGKHNSKQAIDKQVNDKERVSAAMENEAVRSAIEELIKEHVFY